MTTLAQRNAAAFKAMKRTHTVTVGGINLEILPPGLVEIIERVEAVVSAEDIKSFTEGNIDIPTILRKVPALARWLAVRSLGGEVDSSDEVEEYVLTLTPDEFFELGDGIVAAILPDVEATKKKLAALGSRVGLVAVEK